MSTSRPGRLRSLGWPWRRTTGRRRPSRPRRQQRRGRAAARREWRRRPRSRRSAAWQSTRRRCCGTRRCRRPCLRWLPACAAAAEEGWRLWGFGRLLLLGQTLAVGWVYVVVYWARASAGRARESALGRPEQDRPNIKRTHKDTNMSIIICTGKSFWSINTTTPHTLRWSYIFSKKKKTKMIIYRIKRHLCSYEIEKYDVVADNCVVAKAA